jgi:hypothetical protein
MKIKMKSRGSHAHIKPEERKRKRKMRSTADATTKVKANGKETMDLRKPFAVPNIARTLAHLHHLTSTTLKLVESKPLPASISQSSGGSSSVLNMDLSTKYVIHLFFSF